MGTVKWVRKPNGRMYEGKIVAEQKKLFYAVGFDDTSIKTFADLNDIKVKIT